MRAGLTQAELVERTLTLNPTERLDELTSTVAFIRAGRDALAEKGG